jgi:hypothetical protein
MFASERIAHSDNDKVWKTADGMIKKAFKEYPPSPKAIEEKKKQWAEDAAANSQ